GARAAATATAALASLTRSAITTAIGRSKNRELLFQFSRAALGALGAFPVAGPHNDFAVPTAFFAMKLVNRHARRITPPPGISSRTYDPSFGSRVPHLHSFVV